MFIHLGGERIIRTAELIAILDISMNDPQQPGLSAFRDRLDKQAEIIGDEEPKSVVVTKDKIYYSPISTMTLKKRANQLIPNS